MSFLFQAIIANGNQSPVERQRLSQGKKSLDKKQMTQSSLSVCLSNFSSMCLWLSHLLSFLILKWIYRHNKSQHNTWEKTLLKFQPHIIG